MDCNENSSAHFQEEKLSHHTNKRNQVALSNLTRFLSEHNECYILITCGKPSKVGKMQVEMTYEGDPTLATYLIEGASAMIEEKEALKSHSS